MDKLNFDSFGEIMDKFIFDNPIQMLIEIPEKSNDAVLEDNTGMGPVMQFYIFLNAAKKCVEDVISMMDIDRSEWPKAVDSILDLLRNALVGGERK